MSYSKTFGNILIFLVIIAIIFFGYKYFIAGSPEEEIRDLGASTSPAGEEVAGSDTEAFVAIMESLESVDLKAVKFLEDPLFSNSLKDFSSELPKIDTGRENPFAAIGTGGGAKTQTTDKKPNPKPASEDSLPLETEVLDSQL